MSARMLLIVLLPVPGGAARQEAQCAPAYYCGPPGEVCAVNREAVTMAVESNRISIQCAAGQ